MKYHSLKSRVLFWFGSVSFIILLLFSIAFNYFLNNSINANIQNRLQNIAEQIPSTKNFKNVGAAIVKNYKIINKNKAFTLKNISYYLKQKKNFFIIAHNQDDDFIDALYIDKRKNMTVLIFQKNIDNKIENFQDVLLFLIPLLLITLIFLASKLIDKILIPIRNLTKATRNISITKFLKDIPLPQKEDEIKGLVISFNSMIERLKDGVEKLDRFNNDVSHELKTPLTIIKGEVEITLRKIREPQEYQKSMQTILSQSEQIESIINQLLLLTKYSKENIQDSFELCNLDSILLDVISTYEIQLKEKDLNLKIEKLEHISLHANPILLQSIFSNLIDNAIKYTPHSKNITIFLYKKNKIHFIIQDEGIGIEKEQLPKITDRFYRIDESRNKKIKGFGLGLSIVKNSVALHNGTLKIMSTINQGTLVDVSFK